MVGDGTGPPIFQGPFMLLSAQQRFMNFVFDYGSGGGDDRCILAVQPCYDVSFVWTVMVGRETVMCVAEVEEMPNLGQVGSRCKA
jgi:hypothetical protein